MPLAARAQQPAIPVIGFLESGSRSEFANRVEAFREGLAKCGYSEGRNLTIEYRFAEGQYDDPSSMAADLVRRDVAILIATGRVPDVTPQTNYAAFSKSIIVI